MMKYDEILDHLILNYETLKIVLFEETKHLFRDRPYILEKWKKQAYSMTAEEVKNNKPTEDMLSFGALYLLFTEAFYHQKPITKAMIREVVNVYGDTIKAILAGNFYQEFPDDVKRHSMNKPQIDEAMQQDYILSSTDIDFHLMRNIVTKKKDFKAGETGKLATEIIDNKGKVKGVAELRPNEIQATFTADQQQMWLEMLGETLNSLDDLTADLFDLISYLWLTSPKTADGYIEFHSNDALQLRNIKKRTVKGQEYDYREEDRFNIMKRVAALSSIWVSLGERKVHILNSENIQENELYKFKDFQRMFEIGAIRVAYDRNTNEAKGIFAVQVRPTSLLTPYLEGPNRTLGILDIKVFQYNHYTQRAHKRLTRYLNLQWRIRTVKRNLNQPFKVGTLLKEMDFSSRYSGVEIRDLFENTLDDLKDDGVIKEWSYVEEIDENRVGRVNWVKNYWSKLNILLTPPEFIIKENQRNFSIPFTAYQQPEIFDKMNSFTNADIPTGLPEASKEIATTIEMPLPVQSTNSVQYVQQTFEFAEPEISLTPEAMKETLERCKLSIRQAAEEIGIAHTTLSRYLRRENKRPNKKNDEKMAKWLNSKK
ncbi:helix-turn-helix domain-containing protein [Cytobacillus firmus]|uniref:helix-turn-helix domain-containing protein n=1 Tax=Cytobacillus firmus TaxID=1399 RepID=UPI001F54A8A2|nr:helix-turn-helix domain-containing protein [Cytobacillus firmus]